MQHNTLIEKMVQYVLWKKAAVITTVIYHYTLGIYNMIQNTPNIYNEVCLESI